MKDWLVGDVVRAGFERLLIIQKLSAAKFLLCGLGKYFYQRYHYSPIEGFYRVDQYYKRSLPSSE